MFGHNRNVDVNELKSSIQTDIEQADIEYVYKALESIVSSDIFTENVYYYAINKVLDSNKYMQALMKKYEKEYKSSPLINKDTTNPTIDDYTEEFIQYVSNCAMDIVDIKSSDGLSFDISDYVVHELIDDTKCEEIIRYFAENGRNISVIPDRTISGYIDKAYNINSSTIEKIAYNYIDDHLPSLL